MANNFDIEWEIDDGYVCGNRPHTTNVDDDILDDEMDDSDLEELYHEIVVEEFMQNISNYGTNLEEFKEWAQTAIKAMKEEDNE